MNVQSVMTSKPACCTTSTPLREVAQMMVQHDCGQIPVVDEAGKPVGVITDRDITVRMVAAGRETLTGCAADAMSSPAQTISLDSALKDAACLMEGSKIRRVPVVDAAGKLTGMISLADLALSGKDEATMEVVKEVSAPTR